MACFYARTRTAQNPLLMTTRRKVWPEEKACRDIAEHLSRQEKMAATLTWAGCSHKEIASAMRISIRTTRFHLQNAFRKTGCRSDVELALLVERAVRTNLSLLTGSTIFFLVPQWMQRRK
jgi:DNA-binding NarL/FixJ family response regulator